MESNLGPFELPIRPDGSQPLEDVYTVLANRRLRDERLAQAADYAVAEADPIEVHEEHISPEPLG